MNRPSPDHGTVFLWVLSAIYFINMKFCLPTFDANRIYTNHSFFYTFPLHTPM